MGRRFVTIWFPHLLTDWMGRHQPILKKIPFVLATPTRGRMLVIAANSIAASGGIFTGMTVADARAFVPSLQVVDDKPDQAIKLLKSLGEWCTRYTPVTASDPPDGLILDASGCAHLWGSEQQYIDDIVKHLNQFGYNVKLGMADTIGTAWAVARFGESNAIIKSGCEADALIPLPPEALRLEPAITEKLYKLGLNKISSFIAMPRSALRRRFGQSLLCRLDQALGFETEQIEPIEPAAIYQERLVCFDPIRTATGIEIALRRVLEQLCQRLRREEKGIRNAVFKCYRLDGKIEQIGIGTNRPSTNADHLFKLFELKIPTIDPDLGIELFILEASKVEDISPVQETLWNEVGSLQDAKLSELLDRISSKVVTANIYRYLPDEHYWPERSIKLASSLEEKPTTQWRNDQRRPIHLLREPKQIEVTAPIPDYPPMLFRYQGLLHKIKKADGPERIEREWWLDKGLPRDYYCVEDEEGRRYWLFRSGHYDGDKLPAWFIHGFFA